MATEKESKSEKSKSSDPFKSIPLAGWIVIAVVVVGLLVVFTGQPVAPVAQNTNTIPETPTVPTTSPTADNPSLPSTFFILTLSSEHPVAGQELSVIATVKPGFEETPGIYPFELGARQFGNWQTKQCYDSPCTLSLPPVSQGNFEYRAIRYSTASGTTTEVLDGQYSTTVESTTKIGDTIAPKISVSVEPATPKKGNSVTLKAFVQDISGLDKVEVYVNDVLVKTCPDDVKIATCITVVSNVDTGDYNYSVKAWDTYGNLGELKDQSFTVAAK